MKKRDLSLPSLIRISILVASCFSIILLSKGALAGNHWLSGDRIKVEQGAALKAEAQVPRIRIFDIVISLYNNPSTQAERKPYEEIIGYFADAVYEATEGAHKIGKVSIYTNWDHKWKADIRWGKTGKISSATPLALWISMNDIDDSLDYVGGNDEFYRKLGGYVLAHEWGHYKYKLFEEYAQGFLGCLPISPFSSCELLDKEVEPSIMNNQNQAILDSNKDGVYDYEWLNFSIPWKEGGGPFRNTKRTAQHRMYGASCWEVLATDPKDGFKNQMLVGAIFAVKSLLSTSFPELATVAKDNKVLENGPQIQLPNPDARSELKIIWMTDKLVYQIVLDKSGSMGFEPGKMENAKNAAKNLVNMADTGKTAIGVIAFDSSVRVVQSITNITDDSVKEAIKSAIDGISAGGGTRVGAAAQEALNGLLQRGETEGRVVFLLTDGQSGDDPRPVIPSYMANHIPLFTFAYGTDADQDLLREMADRTRGKFYFSPTTLAQITQAFNDAKREVSSTLEGVKSGSFILAPISVRSSAQTIEFPVDSTINKFTVNLAYNGGLGDLVINLQDPNGNIYNVSECSESGSETLCVYTHNAPQAGIWQISLNPQTSNPLNITYDIDGSSENEISYSLSVTNLTGTTVQYPTPILLLASFSKELPIAGAVISGTVEFPDGTTQQLNFRDDGVAPDYMADDGNYSAVFTDYSMNGVYKINVSVNNSNNTARMTAIYNLRSIAEDSIETPPDIPIEEDVERVHSLQVTIEGVVDDDHGNDSSTATEITADNSDHPGKIEIAGDIDFFKVNVPNSSASEVIFRVTYLSPNMLPVLAVYDKNGVLLQEEAYAGGNNYIFISLNPNGKNVFYASVRHHDDSGNGTYYFSAGSEVGSDIVACQCPEDGLHGCISGIVTKIGTGEPVAGKLVWLRLSSKKGGKKFVKRAVTDENGCYIFDNLSSGRYNVFATGGCKADGGRGSRQSVNIIRNGKVNDVNFECQ